MTAPRGFCKLRVTGPCAPNWRLLSWPPWDPNRGRTESGPECAFLEVCLSHVSPVPNWGLPVSLMGLCTECGVGITIGRGHQRTRRGLQEALHLRAQPNYPHPQTPPGPSGLQAEALRGALGSRPLGVPQLPYPECPEWNLGRGDRQDVRGAPEGRPGPDACRKPPAWACL